MPEHEGSADTLDGEGLGARVAAALAGSPAERVPKELARARVRAALLEQEGVRVELGRYLLLHRIGQGGMGVVYAAYDPELDRRIALKIVATRERDGSQGRARLLREAQALARLNHPNVVTVHDVGVVDDFVWIAMELVEGRTLAAWIAAERPSAAAILDVLLRAGAGIAAAHQAGLVHRDIKPENVMIAAGDSGVRRVLVMDFGLARVTDDPSTEPEPHGEAAPSGTSTTRTGAIAGTPAYMAPEQHIGAAVDARTDQFGFCIMAWEAIFGERPFAGKSVPELAMAVCEGRRRPAPRRVVPEGVRRALERGLSNEPADRFRDMDELLAAIARGRSRRRRLVLGVVALGLVLALAAVPVVQHQQHLRGLAGCSERAASIAEVWPADDAPDRVLAAFAATGSAIAAESSMRVEAGLTAWTEAWRDVADEVCRAALDDRGDADELARTSACLDERRQAVELLVGALAVSQVADAIPVHRGVSAVSLLEQPRTCLDAARARNELVPPAELDTEEIADVRHGLERLRILRSLGQHRAARGEAEALLARAQKTGWPPVALETRLEAGMTLDEAGDPAAAEPLLVDSYIEALTNGRDVLAIVAAQQLVFIVGYQLARPEEGLMWGRHGEGLVARTHAAPIRAARMSTAIATVLAQRGQPAEALARYLAVLDVFRTTLGDHHPQVADMIANIAMLEVMLGEHAAAEAHYREALAIAEEALGENHPDVASILNDIAVTQASRGDMRGALPMFERVLAIRERALGPDHPLVVHALTNLAGTLRVLGNDAAAEPLLRRAIAVHERALGPDHPDIGAPLYVLGSLLLARGELDEADALFRRALDVRTRGLGEHDPAVAEPLTGLATIALARGRADEAVELAERAVELRRDAPPLLKAESSFTLAQALDTAGRDRERALELARLALADLAGEEPANQRLEVEAWLRAREGG